MDSKLIFASNQINLVLLLINFLLLFTEQVTFKPDEVKTFNSSVTSNSPVDKDEGIKNGKETKSVLKNSNGNVLKVKPFANGQSPMDNNNTNETDQSVTMSHSEISLHNKENSGKDSENMKSSRELSIIEERNSSRCSSKNDKEIKKG